MGCSHWQACLLPGDPAQSAADIELAAIAWSHLVNGAAAMPADMATKGDTDGVCGPDSVAGTQERIVVCLNN